MLLIGYSISGAHGSAEAHAGGAEGVPAQNSEFGGGETQLQCRLGNLEISFPGVHESRQQQQQQQQQQPSQALPDVPTLLPCCHQGGRGGAGGTCSAGAKNKRFHS